jgi:hypothetical protein
MIFVGLNPVYGGILEQLKEKGLYANSLTKEDHTYLESHPNSFLFVPSSAEGFITLVFHDENGKIQRARFEPRGDSLVPTDADLKESKSVPPLTLKEIKNQLQLKEKNSIIQLKASQKLEALEDAQVFIRKNANSALGHFSQIAETRRNIYFLRPSSEKGNITVTYVDSKGEIRHARFKQIGSLFLPYLKEGTEVPYPMPIDEVLKTYFDGFEPYSPLSKKDNLKSLMTQGDQLKSALRFDSPDPCEKEPQNEKAKQPEDNSPLSEILKRERKARRDSCFSFFGAAPLVSQKELYLKNKKKILRKAKKYHLSSEEIKFDDTNSEAKLCLDEFSVKALFPETNVKFAADFRSDRKNSERLVKEAKQAFERYSVPEKKPLGFDVQPTSSVRQILENLLTHHSDVVIGEVHSDQSSKEALIKNMDLLKKENAIIALEHVLYEPYQRILDEYLNSSSIEMPKRLETYLDYHDRGNSLASKEYNFKALVRSAKENGVRIVAVDTAASYTAGNRGGLGSAGVDRYLGMNYMDKLITDYERNGHKVVHFVGSAHVKSRQGVLGVAELMGNVPTLVFSDLQSRNYAPGIHLNVNQTKMETLFGVVQDTGIKADIFVSHQKD